MMKSFEKLMGNPVTKYTIPASHMDRPFINPGYVHCRKFLYQAIKKAHHPFPFRICPVEVFRNLRITRIQIGFFEVYRYRKISFH